MACRLDSMKLIFMHLHPCIWPPVTSSCLGSRNCVVVPIFNQFLILNSKKQPVTFFAYFDNITNEMRKASVNSNLTQGWHIETNNHLRPQTIYINLFLFLFFFLDCGRKMEHPRIHSKNMQTERPGLQPRTFTLWSNSANTWLPCRLPQKDMVVNLTLMSEPSTNWKQPQEQHTHRKLILRCIY